MTMFWLLASLSTSALAAEPVEDADARARELFLEGDAHYAAGRYELAEQHFLEAYALSQRPLLLFNLANVYERVARYAEAADALRRYLETPDVHDIVSVRERLRRLELAAAQAAEAEAAALEDAPRKARRTREPREERSPEPLPKWPTWALGSATAVGGVTTVTFGVLALQARSDARASCGESPAGTTICTDQAEPFLEQERRLARATDISLATTAVLGISTLAWELARNRRQKRHDQSVSVVPVVRPDGGELQLVITGGGRGR